MWFEWEELKKYENSTGFDILLDVDSEHKEESRVVEKIHGLVETVFVEPENLGPTQVPSLFSCMVSEK